MTNEQLTEQQREVFTPAPLPIHLRRLADQIELVEVFMRGKPPRTNNDLRASLLSGYAQDVRRWADEIEQEESNG